MSNEPDWNRWHELRDIVAERCLTLDEQAEYQEFLSIVHRSDAAEEAISAPAVDALVEQHERVIASLERLTEAVHDAT